MNKKDVVAGILKRIGNRDYDVTTFDNRLLVQKIVYIFQEIMNINLGYNYNLYMRGPYSPDLTKDFYDIKNTKKYDEISLSEETEENLFNNMINILQNYSSDVDILELASTILYIKKKMGIVNVNQIIRRLKPGFTEDQYNLSLSIVEQLESLQRGTKN